MSTKVNLEDKVNIGMVQINNSFSNQDYLPYSVGFLQSYALAHLEHPEDFNFSTPLFRRIPVKKGFDHLIGSDAVFFSTYVWNFNLSTAIAKRIKEEKPETLIVFGGCHVPENGKDHFMQQYPFIDIASTGEGEVPFTEILRNYKNKDWMNVPSITFRDKGKTVTTTPARRIENLNVIPSPYLSGFFDPLMRENPDTNWIGLWETNRGCPFSCTYCDWGTGSKKRMSDYEMERLFKEIDWFSRNKIEFVYCCDANFGLYKDRDLQIVQKMARNKELYGYPQAFSVQNTKNSTEASFHIQSVLTEAGLARGVLLAFQSLNPETLKAVKRGNIHLSTFYDLQKRFNAKKIPTFSDIILGLPGETYDTYTEGVSTLIENGQHNRIQFNNLSILPNAEMGDPEYQRKHGIKIVENKIINMHGSLGEWTDDIYETQKMVVGTNSMPFEDWKRARAFSYMTSLLHFNKLLQLPFVIANFYNGVKFKDIIESFTKVDQTDYPILSEINGFFSKQASSIQEGSSEYCESKKWLNIWWYPDELAMINLIADRKLPAFYQESSRVLENIVKDRGINDASPIRQAMLLNQNLIKLPFQNSVEEITLNYNIWDAYRAGLTHEKLPITPGKYTYKIDKTAEKWNSWEDWCEKVVWWGNKKGAYLYDCIPLSGFQEVPVENQ